MPLNFLIICLFFAFLVWVFTFLGHSSGGVDWDQNIKMHPFAMILCFVCFMHVLGDERHNLSLRLCVRRGSLVWDLASCFLVILKADKFPDQQPEGQRWGKASVSLSESRLKRHPKGWGSLLGLPQLNLCHSSPKDEVLCKWRIRVIPSEGAYCMRGRTKDGVENMGITQPTTVTLSAWELVNREGF